MVKHFDGCLCAIESALDGWVRMMMRKSVAVRWIARLSVSVAARRVHVVSAMRFYLLVLLAAHNAVVKGGVLGAVGCVDYRIGLRAGHAVVLRMLLAATSLPDLRSGITSRALAGIVCGLSIASVLPDALLIL
jgi:hypothetical protein